MSGFSLMERDVIPHKYTVDRTVLNRMKMSVPTLKSIVTMSNVNMLLIAYEPFSIFHRIVSV